DLLGDLRPPAGMAGRDPNTSPRGRGGRQRDRPAAGDPRSPLAELAAPPGGRADGHQLPFPVAGGGHHQDRDGPPAPRAGGGSPEREDDPAGPRRAGLRDPGERGGAFAEIVPRVMPSAYALQGAPEVKPTAGPNSA